MSDPIVPILGAALATVTGLAFWILGTVWAEVRKLREAVHDLRHDLTVVMFALDLTPTTKKHPHNTRSK